MIEPPWWTNREHNTHTIHGDGTGYAADELYGTNDGDGIGDGTTHGDTCGKEQEAPEDRLLETLDHGVLLFTANEFEAVIYTRCMEVVRP